MSSAICPPSNPPPVDIPTWLFGGPTEEVLYEADLPVVFTRKTPAGTMLVYTAQIPDRTQLGFLIFTLIQNSALMSLKEGTLPVRDAITSGAMFLALQDGEGNVQTVWPIQEKDLPEGRLPMPGTLLLPHHHER